MLSSKALKDIVTEARPIIERQIDDAELIAGFRDLVADQGGDWSALKALIKAQIQDERDDSGKGKRVKKILDKAGFSTDYADMLGWAIMNEKNFSADEDHDPITGEVHDINPRLAKQIVDGMQTEAGRAVLGAAVDIMIEGEEAEEQNSPETANETPKQVYGDSVDLATAEPSQSVDIPAGGDKPLTIDGSDEQRPAAFHSPSDDDAISEVNGKAGLANAAGVEPSSSATIDPDEDRPEAQSLDGSVDANAGGDHVTAEATSGRGFVTTSTAHQPLRPLCLKPDQCGGYGDKTCHACTVAARTTGEAA